MIPRFKVLFVSVDKSKWCSSEIFTRQSVVHLDVTLPCT